MLINGVIREWSNPLFIYFRTHLCPFCNKSLIPVKTSIVIHSHSDEAKDYDFSSGDGYLQGNVKFIRTALFCKDCNKTYTINEIKESERK
jgi:uncharacterized protein YbaR (Trm112 family)